MKKPTLFFELFLKFGLLMSWSSSQICPTFWFFFMRFASFSFCGMRFGHAKTKAIDTMSRGVKLCLGCGFYRLKSREGWAMKYEMISLCKECRILGPMKRIQNLEMNCALVVSVVLSLRQWQMKFLGLKRIHEQITKPLTGLERQKKILTILRSIFPIDSNGAKKK